MMERAQGYGQSTISLAALQPMNVDLTSLGRGIYYIQLGDFNGKPLASGNVFIY